VKVSSTSFKDAFVHVDLLKADVHIPGLKERNRALPGDVVCVRLLPRSQWTNRKADRVVEKSAGVKKSREICEDHALWLPLLGAEKAAHHKGDDDGDAAVSPGISSTAFPADLSSVIPGDLQAKGEVVCILKRGLSAKNNHMGHLELPNKASGGKLRDTDRFVNFMPNDKRQPRVLISRHTLPDLYIADPSKYERHLVECAIESWPLSSQLPHGKMLRFVGEMDDIEVETACLLSENGVDHGPFPQAVLDDLQCWIPSLERGGKEWQIPEEVVRERRDMRKTRIFTIDPTRAKDLDDALHITEMKSESGGVIYEVGVHIADVSYFVKPGTALDAEVPPFQKRSYLSSFFS
jgi:exoribonuclease R